jgi:membrane protein DedA with SNARE-associated domain
MLNDLIELITNMTTSMIDQFGLSGIFIGMVLEGACLPLPSEVILPIGGFFVEKGTFHFWEVVCAGVLGNLIGSIIIYWIGARVARSILYQYGKYFLLSQNHIEKSEAWFSKNGEWVIFFGRNLPFVRSIISLPAGISKMNFAKFCLYTLFGCIPWNIALIYCGYSLGANWNVVESYVRPVSYGIGIVFILLIFCFIYKIVREKNKKEEMI